MSVQELCRAAQRAARELAGLPRERKDAALDAVAEALERRSAEILRENDDDVRLARANRLAGPLIDRLLLDEDRVGDMVASVRAVAALPDPVGQVVDGWRLANGVDVRKVRVPLGVVAVVYEARPNVTVDAAALCLKTGQRRHPARGQRGQALQPHPRRGRPGRRPRGGPAEGGRRLPRRRPRRAGRAGARSGTPSTSSSHAAGRSSRPTCWSTARSR